MSTLPLKKNENPNRKIICLILTTPNRQQYLPNMIKKLEENNIEYKLYVDPAKLGHIGNSKLLYAEIPKYQDLGYTVIATPDDIDFCDNFRDRLEELIDKAPYAGVYCLFTRLKYFAKTQRNGFGYGIFLNNLYDHGIVFTESFRFDYDKFWKDCEDYVIEHCKKRGQYFDIFFQERMTLNEHPRVVAYPTLTEHVGTISALKHSIGKSALFIDDI